MSTDQRENSRCDRMSQTTSSAKATVEILVNGIVFLGISRVDQSDAESRSRLKGSFSLHDEA